jgi:hypothetical protein
MKIVVQMVPLPAMLGAAENTWMAFAIMADATNADRGREIASSSRSNDRPQVSAFAQTEVAIFAIVKQEIGAKQ